jgi:hypothetical protein
MPKSKRRKITNPKPVSASGIPVDFVVFTSADAFRAAVLDAASRAEVSGTASSTTLFLAAKDAAMFGIGRCVNFTLQDDHAELVWYPPGEDLVAYCKPKCVRFLPPKSRREALMTRIRDVYAKDPRRAVVELLATGLITERRLP